VSGQTSDQLNPPAGGAVEADNAEILMIQPEAPVVPVLVQLFLLQPGWFLLQWGLRLTVQLFVPLL